MPSAEIINLDDRRPKTPAMVINTESDNAVAVDVLADGMACELVSTLMADFIERTGAEFENGEYTKQMDAMTEIARMMTHRHFEILDDFNLMLDQNPDSSIIIGIKE